MKTINNIVAIPFDIKFINVISNGLFFCFFVLLILNGFHYILKNNIKNFSAISIKGDILHTDVDSLRNKITSNIVGNFYSINLSETKKIFETMPWVSRAVVRRVYPSQIEANFTEYKSKAIWGAREDMKLVDESGVIFEANSQDDEHDQIPQLLGPEGQSKYMLNMYKNVLTALSPLKQKLKTLELNARGSWIVKLDSGAHIELGRGGTVDVVDRASKFAAGVEQMLTSLNKKPVDIQYVDLRHSEGYAIRLNGVGTIDLTAGNVILKK